MATLPGCRVNVSFVYPAVAGPCSLQNIISHNSVKVSGTSSTLLHTHWPLGNTWDRGSTPHQGGGLDEGEILVLITPTCRRYKLNTIV